MEIYVKLPLSEREKRRKFQKKPKIWQKSVILEDFEKAWGIYPLGSRINRAFQKGRVEMV